MDRFVVILLIVSVLSRMIRRNLGIARAYRDRQSNMNIDSYDK